MALGRPGLLEAAWSLPAHRPPILLEKKAAAAGGGLAASQIHFLQTHRATLGLERHAEFPHSRHLLCQDTYFVGTIKGIGTSYLHVVIDAHRSSFARLREALLSKVPLTTTDILNDRIVLFSLDPAVE